MPRELEKVPSVTTPESLFFTGINATILGEDQFKSIKTEHGFTSGFRGTWKSERDGLYLYVKGKMNFENESQAVDSLHMAQYLTAKDVLYPHTQWGIYKTLEGRYQLFAVTRELEGWTPEGDKVPGRQKVLADIGEEYNNIFCEGSHVLEWMKRVDPDFDPNSRPKNELVLLLNWVEASHRDNWAWDEKGKLYPIDIEVLSLGAEEYQLIIANWAKADKQEN